MAAMSKRNKILLVTIMLASLLQMVQFALTPGIAKIQSEVFSQYPIWVIQTAMTLPSLLSMVFSLLSAFLIGKRILSKKASVLIGLGLITVTSLVALVLHTQFWHLCLYSVLIGSGMGFYISTSASIMFDNFNEHERRIAVGTQTSVINLGGIIMSVLGGILANIVWFGGYLVLILGLPIMLVCLFGIPNDKKERELSASATAERLPIRIPKDVLYYGAITFIFLLIFTVGGTNISNHLKAGGVGDTATAGVATAVQMAGGVTMGLFFNKVSARLKDYTLALAFVLVFMGYTVINLGQRSLALDFVGIFITGTAISIIIPQTLFSTANHVNETNSAAAIAIVNTIFPGLGSFFSPGIFTTVTTALGGDSTNFRYQFVGVVALAVGLILVVTTHHRDQKGGGKKNPVPGQA